MNKTTTTTTITSDTFTTSDGTTLARLMNVYSGSSLEELIRDRSTLLLRLTYATSLDARLDAALELHAIATHIEKIEVGAILGN